MVRDWACKAVAYLEWMETDHHRQPTGDWETLRALRSSPYLWPFCVFSFPFPPVFHVSLPLSSTLVLVLMLQVSYLSFGYFLFYFETLVFTCVLWFYFLCLFFLLLLFFSALPRLFPLMPSSHLCLTYQSTACAYTHSLAFPSVYHHINPVPALFVCFFISAVTFATECDEQPVFKLCEDTGATRGNPQRHKDIHTQRARPT